MFKAVTLTLISLPLTGCMSVEEIILPSKYERIAQANAYKSCVASATNSRFDDFTKPELIVRNSLTVCSHFKDNMLRAYPKTWRENYLKEVDSELYRREVDWIVEARTRKNKFFR